MKKKLICFILAVLVCFVFSSCGESFETVKLINCEGAIISFVSAKNIEDNVNLDGMLLESESSYEGLFNAVFENNFGLTFGFRKGEPAAFRRFTFTFMSVRDSSKNFSVVYESVAANWTGEASGRGCSGVYVKWGDQVRTSSYWRSDPVNDTEAWQNNDNFNVYEALASPMFGGVGEKETEGFGKIHGTLSLKWTNEDILEIYVSDRFHKYTPRLIAAFDGSSEGFGYDPSLKMWGLPRMEISDGYTISFRSEVFGGNVTEPNAPDVYFSEIRSGKSGQERTYSLTEAKMQVPPFYRENV